MSYIKLPDSFIHPRSNQPAKGHAGRMAEVKFFHIFKEYIDKDQQQSIYDLCERNDMDIAALEKYLKSKKINSIEEVETWAYPKIIEKLNEAIKK